MSDPAAGPLSGRICLVAGASRGVGRGVARALGEAGATVVVTGRSSEAGPRTDGRPETFEDTAREVEAAGGKGHPYRCDHTSEREIDTLVSWMLRRFGRIDCVVDCVWGANDGFDGERYLDGSSFGTPFWRRPVARLGHALESSLYARLLLARAVAPSMVRLKAGIIVELTAATEPGYLGDGVYDLAAASLNRLVVGMAAELGQFGVSVVGVAPDSVATERVRDAGFETDAREAPIEVGRAIAGLLAAPGIESRAGRILTTADVARRPSRV